MRNWCLIKCRQKSLIWLPLRDCAVFFLHIKETQYVLIFPCDSLLRFRRKGPKVLRGMPQESRSKFLPATEAAGAVATNGTRWQPDGIDLEDSRIPTYETCTGCRSSSIVSTNLSLCLRPDEYLRYVLEQLNYDVVDNHFRPQFLTCPFCELNFTIYRLNFSCK